MKRKLFFAISFFTSLIIVNNNALADGVVVPPNTGLPSGTLSGVIKNLTYWLLGIFGFLAIIAFLVSGIMYLTAAGDEDQQKKAKKAMQWSVIGVIVGLSGYVVIKAVDAWLFGSSTF